MTFSYEPFSAYRHISVKFIKKTINNSGKNPPPASVKTVADWIRVIRHKNGLAKHHLAQKMGITSHLIAAWEAGSSRPDTRYIRILVAFLGQLVRSQSLNEPDNGGQSCL